MSFTWRDPQVWTELHDLEQRVGRLEATQLAETEARDAVTARDAQQRERHRWVLPVLISLSGVTVGLLGQLHAFG